MSARSPHPRMLARRLSRGALVLAAAAAAALALMMPAGPVHVAAGPAYRAGA